MKLVLMIFSTLALLSLGINAQNETLASADTVTVGITSASNCYCHISLVGLNALYQNNKCPSKLKQLSINAAQKLYEKIRAEECATGAPTTGHIRELPTQENLEFTDENCQYVFNLLTFEARGGVGTNWQGKKPGMTQYYGGKALQSNRDGKVVWWRKQGRINDGRCNCLNKATFGCPGNKNFLCWWDESENVSLNK